MSKASQQAAIQSQISSAQSKKRRLFGRGTKGQKNI